MNKIKNSLFLYLPIATILFIGFVSPVNAEEKDTEEQYEFYPTPHHIEYGDGETSLDKEVQVIYDETIDEATKEKVEDVLKDNDLAAPEVAEEPSDDKLNLFVGTEGSDGPAEQYAKEELDGSKADFDKIDAYQLAIKDDAIAILGKDTDAAFYGVVSLETILNQSQDEKVQNVSINDYANTEVRGFIEGFYGIPWSNEDRMSLMEFGGNFKTNSYIFAPKDDPYHREKWEELYPEQELKEISEMAEVGRQTKTQFVWTISPLGEVASIAQENGDDAAMELLDENTEKMLAKFDQLYDAGVRQFGVLGDDVGALPLDYVVELMDAVSEWADEKGDVNDTLYTPAAYNSAWAWDGGKELNKLEEGFADNIHILWTGENTVAPVEQYTIDRFKNRDNDGVERRDPLFWLNWPVNDVDMTRVFLGKGDMLDPGVENLAGVVTNPMQEAEASKISIFAVADYTWNTETFDADKSWKDSMKYIEPDASEAFYTLAKHMTHSDPQVGMEADESEDIKALLEKTLAQLEENQELGDASELIDELNAIAKAGDDFLNQSKNESLKEELKPFIDALQDMVLADVEYLKAQQAIESDDAEIAKEHYLKGQSLREQSLNHERPMLDGEDKVNAKPAGKRLQPFTDELEKQVTKNAKEVLDVDVMIELVEQYAETGDIKEEDDARKMQTHLTSLQHYADKESYDKAEKHMKSFNQLIDKYEKDEKIEKEAAEKLTLLADVLIEKWQS